MSVLSPIVATEATAARLMDMTIAEFRAAVKAGYLPQGREIAPGLLRWSVDDFRRIITGVAVDGMDGVVW